MEGPQATVLCQGRNPGLGEPHGCCLELDSPGWDSGSLPKTGRVSEQLPAMGGEAAVSHEEQGDLDHSPHFLFWGKPQLSWAGEF